MTPPYPDIFGKAVVRNVQSTKITLVEGLSARAEIQGILINQPQ
jgi:hypothetical protein